VKRFLVTTAIEQTWPKDGPVLFLGEWCRLYNRKSVWEKLDVEIAPYHWDDRARLQQDYQYLQSLYEALLEELTEKLNKLHGVAHTLRYWRILIGPWLGWFIQMLFDRWAMLNRAISGCEAVKCRVLATDSASVIPNDMSQFVRSFAGDYWNEAIYAQLLIQSWKDEVEIEQVDNVAGPILDTGDTTCKPLHAAWKQLVMDCVAYTSRATTRSSDFFIYNSGLPLKVDFELQLRMRQCPKLWRTMSVPRVKPDMDSRQWEWGKNDSDKFSIAARYMIPRHIPAVYLEGFQQLTSHIHSLHWPEQPKGIFTSSAYFTDDSFKAWTAEKAQEGAPLVIGQHGGHFGMAPWSFHEEHQIAIADTWLSWGWEDNRNAKVVPVGKFQDNGRKIDYDAKGSGLLVEMTMPRYSYHMYAAPTASQWLSYFDEQCRFISALPENIRHRILVRQYQHDYGWQQKERWQEKFPDLRLDDGSTPMHNLVEQSRLYISTYNATTYLESLGWNIPTIMFWNTAHWELREEVIPYFEMLKSVGIFHETPEGAARQMTTVWDDVSSWWESQSVQEAREEFCNRYSRNLDKPLQTLEPVFRKAFTL
jgi:putative transferase (TIGR04331 family)